MMRVFVYGTLQKGLVRHYALEQANFLGYGTIKATLYDLGSYPGIKEGDFDVYGELYEVDETILKELDKIEAYYPEFPEKSHYIRKEVQVKMQIDDSIQTAFVYYYNGKVDESNLIPSGNYKVYLGGG